MVRLPGCRQGCGAEAGRVLRRKGASTPMRKRNFRPPSGNFRKLPAIRRLPAAVRKLSAAIRKLPARHRNRVPHDAARGWRPAAFGSAGGSRCKCRAPHVPRRGSCAGAVSDGRSVCGVAFCGRLTARDARLLRLAPPRDRAQAAARHGHQRHRRPGATAPPAADTPADTNTPAADTPAAAAAAAEERRLVGRGLSRPCGWMDA